MKRPKEVLSPEDYTNYRNIRAIAILYLPLAVCLLLIGFGTAFIDMGVGAKPAAFVIKYTFSFLVVLWGLAGLVGAVAVLQGSTKWSSLVWTVGGMYMAFFPLGTLLSIIFFRGLKKYYLSIDEITAFNAADDAQSKKPLV